MGAFAHKIKSSRKILTLREWAYLYKVKPASISHHIKQYEKEKGIIYDSHDAYSVIFFDRYMQKKRKMKIKTLQETLE